jgi:thiamine pyrophosphokinase
MSSHHIVRENQEPALLIMDALAISFEKIQELLEWMPTVIVHYTEVEIVLGWGIKVDVVIVPVNELENWRNKLIDQAPIKLLSFNPTDDPLATALFYMNATKASGVNVLLKQKSDLNNLEAFSQLDMEAFIAHQRWCLIKGGHVEKWYPADTDLYIYPQDLTLQEVQFTSGSIRVSKDGIVSLDAARSFWLGENL